MNKGFSTIIVVFVVLAVAVVTTITGYFFLGTNSEEGGRSSEKLILEVANSSKEVDGAVTITHITDRFARGEVDIEDFQVVFFALIGDEWKVIETTSDSIWCEKMAKFGVPASMISDCVLKYPSAQTVADILKSSSGSADVIGVISFPNDPACSNCFSITSGGESIEVVLDEEQVLPRNLQNISDGDMVVVEMDYDSGNGVVSNIEEVEDSSSEDRDLSEELYYDVTDLPPNVVPPGPEFYRSLYDIDNSGEPIEILSDF